MKRIPTNQCLVEMAINNYLCAPNQVPKTVSAITALLDAKDKQIAELEQAATRRDEHIRSVDEKNTRSKSRIAVLEADNARLRGDREKLLNIARGCHDYGGGYSEQRDADIYHHVDFDNRAAGAAGGGNGGEAMIHSLFAAIYEVLALLFAFCLCVLEMLGRVVTAPFWLPAWMFQRRGEVMSSGMGNNDSESGEAMNRTQISTALARLSRDFDGDDQRSMDVRIAVQLADEALRLRDEARLARAQGRREGLEEAAEIAGHQSGLAWQVCEAIRARIVQEPTK